MVYDKIKMFPNISFNSTVNSTNSDVLSGHPILTALYVVISVTIIILLISSCWIFYTNINSRVVFKATLPNHKAFFQNNDNLLLEVQEMENDISTNRKVGKIRQSEKQKDDRKIRNYLPATLTPHATKSSISSNSEISKLSNKINSKLPANESPEKDEDSNDGEEDESSKSRIKASDLLSKIQEASLKIEKEEKEKSQQKKKEEENKKKQLELEKKQEPEKKPQTAGKFNFTFNLTGKK